MGKKESNRKIKVDACEAPDALPAPDAPLSPKKAKSPKGKSPKSPRKEKEPESPESPAVSPASAPKKKPDKPVNKDLIRGLSRLPLQAEHVNDYKIRSEMVAEYKKEQVYTADELEMIDKQLELCKSFESKKTKILKTLEKQESKGGEEEGDADKVRPETEPETEHVQWRGQNRHVPLCPHLWAPLLTQT